MFAKLAVVILGIGATGCSLLALRQQRLEAASELARIQVHVHAQDERLWLLRSEIASRVSPENVRGMATALGPLRPLVPNAPVLATAQPAGDGHAGPEIRDAAPLPLPPGSPIRAADRSTSPKPGTKKAPPRYAAVEPQH